MGFKFYGSLETRAKKNGRAIDSEWIYENESNENTLGSSYSSQDALSEAEDINSLLDSVEPDFELFDEKEDYQPVEEVSAVDQIMDSTDVPETQFEEEKNIQAKIDSLEEEKAKISSMKQHLNGIFASDNDFDLASGRRL